jgi:hypothetical protein
MARSCSRFTAPLSVAGPVNSATVPSPPVGTTGTTGTSSPAFQFARYVPTVSALSSADPTMNALAVNSIANPAA